MGEAQQLVLVRKKGSDSAAVGAEGCGALAVQEEWLQCSAVRQLQKNLGQERQAVFTFYFTFCDEVRIPHLFPCGVRTVLSINPARCLPAQTKALSRLYETYGACKVSKVCHG